MDKKKSTVKKYFELGEVGRYFLRLFGKKYEDKPDSINLRLMHCINRIAMIIFILSLLFFSVKKLFF